MEWLKTFIGHVTRDAGRKIGDRPGLAVADDDTERVGENPPMRKSAASRPSGFWRGRASASWHVHCQQRRHVRIWSPGYDLFLILQKLIVTSPYVGGVCHVGTPGASN
jgi:hypothetical protein